MSTSTPRTRHPQAAIIARMHTCCFIFCALTWINGPNSRWHSTNHIATNPFHDVTRADEHPGGDQASRDAVGQFLGHVHAILERARMRVGGRGANMRGVGGMRMGYVLKRNFILSPCWLRVKVVVRGKDRSESEAKGSGQGSVKGQGQG